MNETNIGLIIVGLTTIITGVMTTLTSLHSSHKVDEVHKLVNSQYTALLESRLQLLERLAALQPSASNVQDVETGKRVIADRKGPAT